MKKQNKILLVLWLDALALSFLLGKMAGIVLFLR